MGFELKSVTASKYYLPRGILRKLMKRSHTVTNFIDGDASQVEKPAFKEGYMYAPFFNGCGFIFENDLIVNKKYVIFICDENERVVAFGVCFPAIGDAIKKSGGRLTPAALLRLLRIVKRPRVIDLGLVAVLPEYQNSGINAVMINRMLDMLEKDGIEKYETNLNLETNDAVRAQWKYFNARQHKRRRSYIKKIGK